MKKLFIILIFIFVFIHFFYAVDITPDIIPDITPGNIEPNNQMVVVLVNKTSPYYRDFILYIKPYLDNFGVPYIKHDISEPITADTVNVSLIIIGHKGLDLYNEYLNQEMQDLITDAVYSGTGLINFDSLLYEVQIQYEFVKNKTPYVPRYQYIQDIFNFTYEENKKVRYIGIGESREEIIINCWDNDHQDPDLETETIDESKIDNFAAAEVNLWKEYKVDGPDYFPGIIGDFKGSNRPVMHISAGVPNGVYEVYAQLFWSSNLRYYYTYDLNNSQESSIDVMGGNLHAFDYYPLKNVVVTDNKFHFYMQNMDVLDLYGKECSTCVWGNNGFGLSSIILIPQTHHHYINKLYEPEKIIGLRKYMKILGIKNLPDNAEIVAHAEGHPFIVSRNFGQGKVVQWGSYDFTRLDVKGYVFKLDDLVWRSIVYAARKPFVMQCLPPLLTMRMDDCCGTSNFTLENANSFWWAVDAAELGLKPFISFYIQEMNKEDIFTLRLLINEGKATGSIHAVNDKPTYFYYTDGSIAEVEEQIAYNFKTGNEWHEAKNIPISNFIVPHEYRIHPNSFSHLLPQENWNWDVSFLVTPHKPGDKHKEGDSLLTNGPYFKNTVKTGSGENEEIYTRNTVEAFLTESGGKVPIYFADYLEIPDHLELNNKFFVCFTEITDNTRYEWFPSPNCALTIERGVEQIKRAFDSRVLATLFTHEYFITGYAGQYGGQTHDQIKRDNWKYILRTILDEVSSYNPRCVTMDQAMLYIRALHNSSIAQCSYNVLNKMLKIRLINNAIDIGYPEIDTPTQVYVFYEKKSQIMEHLVDVPAFAESIDISTLVP